MLYGRRLLSYVAYFFFSSSAVGNVDCDSGAEADAGDAARAASRFLDAAVSIRTKSSFDPSTFFWTDEKACCQ